MFLNSKQFTLVYDLKNRFDRTSSLSLSVYSVKDRSLCAYLYYNSSTFEAQNFNLSPFQFISAVFNMYQQVIKSFFNNQI